MTGRAGRSRPRLGRVMWVLMGTFLVSCAGFYLTLPFLAVVYTAQFGLTPGQAGLVLGAIPLADLTAGLVGGPLSDRIGRRFAMVLGLALQAAGFLACAWVRSLPLLIGAGALLGAGGGLFGPAARAAIATLAPSTAARTTAFAMRGIFAGIGMIIGPLLGVLLLGSPLWFFGVAAALHGALALALPVLLPARGRYDPPAPATGNVFPRMLHNLPFIWFSIAAAAIWSLDAQVMTTLPLRVAELTGSAGAMGPLATLNSVLAVTLQVPVNRRLLHRLHPLHAMAVGTLLCGAGLVSVAWARGLVHFAGSVLLIALGQTLYVPTVDTMVSGFAHGQAMGSFFGIATLVWGLGAGAGSVLGTQAVTVARSLALPGLPWYLFGLLALVTAAGVLSLRRWPVLRTAGEQSRP